MRPSVEQQTKTLLMATASRIIALEGMERATTKNIATQARVSETYIYRFFDDKNDLLRQTFLDNDINLRNLLMGLIPMLKDENEPFKERVRRFYNAAVELMLSVPNDAVAYLRFYYSKKYLDLAEKDHHICYLPLLGELKAFFKDDIDVIFLFRYIFESLLTVVYDISTGEIRMTPALSDRLFEMVYSLLKPSLREDYI